ncbi:ATP-dependent helicase HrpB [Microbacterium sp. G2-8]|uniref:ATP-dependent helicase HrpB n=1 Tax=Microbacterium sp. G2-8 TaxID=2842454 RepID=UPI001C8A54F7|nr:ATP-dependent helicase HrpB [Microbacterium sp. G2-8]
MTFDLATIGAGLPVASARSQLEAAIATGAMVVTAPPGTGKTTFVPPLVANAVSGRVVVTQPRRVAVRSAARRIAQLAGTALGGSVGYTVRGERHVSRDTRIEVVTPGILLRRLLADPSLEGVAAVILDEVHERSVDGDLLLGMLTEVRELRDDLALVAMSATLDAGAVSGQLDGAPIVDVPSALHPLTVEYAASGEPRLDLRGVSRAFLAHVARVAADAQAADESDALVFLPGAREVDAVARMIRERSTAEVLPLHGQLASREQDRATSGRRAAEDPARIVVSTALAESSLTVPGVRLVIDAGLSREARRDSIRDMSGLVTVSASRASAEQRAGRAARQGPGRVVRVYSEVDFARMPPASPPEITSADLTDAALLLAAWGTPGGAGLRLLTDPPAASIATATAALRALGLVDDAGRVTRLGSRVAALPVGAREGRALLGAAKEGVSAAVAAETVAALSGGFRDPGGDLTRLLRELRDGRAAGASRWVREVRRLTRLSDDGGHRTEPGLVVALMRPEWIARRVADGSRSYLLASGTRAAVPEGSGLQGSEWIAVAEVQRADGRAADGTGAVIRLAAALTDGDARHVGAALLTRERRATIADGRVRVREEESLGRILLSSTPVSARDEDTGSAFAAHVREHGLDVLTWTPDAIALRGRLALVERELGDPWPAMDDEALLDRLDAWLAPALGRQPALAKVDVTGALRRLLPWPEASRLDELAPEHLAVPSGSRVRIDYPGAADPGAHPAIPVKLQEVFGLAETPRLVDGRVPVVFHLLSPARRPLAVTGDLASFWNGPYADVRKEMRGRYPKHPWPEDPWNAQATARTTRALRR